MNIYHIPGFATVAEAAEKNKVQPRTIRDRVKRADLSYFKIDGLKLIRIDNSPALELPEGVVKGELHWVNKCARRNKIIPERIYEQIILGNINGYTIGGRVFVNPKEPTLIEYLKTAKLR